MKSQVVRVESDSEPGTFYEVNLETFSCTCPYHTRKLHGLPFSDPHHLCKHLVQVLAAQGIPDVFKSYEEDIKQYAKHNASFTDREKALVREKKLEMQTYKEGRTLFTPDMITVLSRSKKRKYYYLDAKTLQKEISATITLNGGDTSLNINDLYASYSFCQNTCSFPDAIRFMAPGIILWLDMEYSTVTGDKRERSDTNVKGIYAQMLNPKPEIPMGAIITSWREKKPWQSIMMEWGEWTEEDFNCILVRGHAEVDDRSVIHEPTEIEAVIPLTGDMVLFRINNSPRLKLTVQQTGEGFSLSIPSDHRGIVNNLCLTMSVNETNGQIMFSTSSNPNAKTSNGRFPQKISYTKEAVFAWLAEEVCKVRNER